MTTLILNQIGSEIYERLPDSGSQGDGLDEHLGSDECMGSTMAVGADSDVYSSLDRTCGNGQGAGSTERLVRPSQIRKNKKQGKHL